MVSPSIRQNLPNALTIMRLILAAAFFGALSAYRYPDIHAAWANIAISLFIAAAITDALDGFLARRWNATSVFGRIMDPFCDKVLILGAFVYLSGARFAMVDPTAGTLIGMATGVYPWMVVVILARELLVTGIRGMVESMGVEFGAKWSGKAKMILQSIVVPLVLFLTVNITPVQGSWSLALSAVLVWITVIVTVWSGVPYVLGLRRLMTQRKGQGP